MRAMVVAALSVALVAGGCGVSSGGDDDTDPNDKRATALECLTEDKDIHARLLGRDAIQLNGADSGPRIRFFLTAGEAEAEQFEGGGEGAEQIKSALLFTRRGSEDTLQAAEECLGEL